MTRSMQQLRNRKYRNHRCDEEEIQASFFTNIWIAVQRRPIIPILSLAFIVRIGYLVAFGGFDNDIHDSLADQYVYLDIASNIVAGDGFSTTNQIWISTPGEPTSIVNPIYPLFLAGMFRTFGDSLIVIRIVQAFISLIVVWSSWKSVSMIFGKHQGVVAGIIASLYPSLIMYIRPIMSEALFIPALSLVVTLYLIIIRSPKPRFILLITWGAFSGIAILLRTEIIALIMVLFIHLAFRQWRGMAHVTHTSLVGAVASIILVLIPYSAYNISAHGTVAPFPNKKWSMWDRTWWAEMRETPAWEGTTYPERIVVPDWDSKTERERDEWLWDAAIDYTIDHPEVYLRRRLQQFVAAYPLIPIEWRYFIPGSIIAAPAPDGAVLGPTSLDDSVRYVTVAEWVRVWSFRLMALFAVIGMWAVFRRRIVDAYVITLVVAWNIAHITLMVGSERLRTQVEPFIIMLGTAGLFAAYDGFENWRRQDVTVMQHPIIGQERQDGAASP